MIEKQALIGQIKAALASGLISDDEVRALLMPPVSMTGVLVSDTSKAEHKLSAVEVMFYIAGIVLFSSIMSMIAQSWDTGSALVHILLSAGVGSGLWALAYRLHKQPAASDVRKGLENAIVLTGSLCVIVGGFIFTNELIGGFEEVNFIPGAITLAVLGAVHIGYDRLVRKDLMILTGLLLSVATFPALLFGILEDKHLPLDVWSTVFIASVILLAYAARVVAKFYPDRMHIAGSFDWFVAFSALGAMFVSSFSEYGVFWLMLMIASVFGLFYLSIVAQNKSLLGNASFFLVLAVLTVSFKYFSGAGVTVSLVIATIGLLGSAAIATGINKKYFKEIPASKTNL